MSKGSSSFMGSLLEAVRRRQNLDRMLRLPTRSLLDLERGQRAVGGGDGRARADRVEQRLRELERQLVVFLLEAPGAVHGRTLLDHVDRGAGNRAQHVRRLVAEVLRPQMTGYVVRHGADRAGEVRVELAGRVELRE